MRNILLIILSVLSLTLLNSQTPEKWTLYVFVGTYGDATVSGDVIVPDEEATPGTILYSSDLGEYKGDVYGLPVLRTAETDTTNTSPYYWPLIFNVPDRDNPNEIIGIHDYLLSYGETDSYGNKTRCYLEFIQEAIPAYWKSMFKKTTGNVDGNIELVFIWPPDATTEKEMWIVPDSGNYSTRMYNFRDIISNTLPEGEFSSYHNRTEKKSVLLMLPEFKGVEYYGFAGGLRAYAYWRPLALNQTTNVIAHELGHSIPGFKDQGNQGAGGTQYSGRVDGEMLGQTFSTSGIYDVMHSSGTLYSPELLYGLMPFCTQDLLNTSGVVIKDKYIEENTENNQTSVTLKAVRETLTDAEYADENLYETISIPISIDLSGDDVALYSYPNFVEHQKFLIEYRNGKKFDDYTEMYSTEKSKGILISHIIGDKYNSRMVDIEIPVPFPEFQEDGITPYRDPSTAWPPSQASKNGIWFFGKKINDWMDDYAPNWTHPKEGGKPTWWRKTDDRNQSLPTDFFNDTDRNMFTPSTRPNTNSWKGAETNIGIFIDKIEGDYADLRIYRNYHSKPLEAGKTKSSSKAEPDLSIKGDGYIGENFYVGENMSLELGGKAFIGNQRTTLVPATNMHVRSGAEVILNNDTKLRLENSKLEFRERSKFSPYGTAAIEIDNSEMVFDAGSIIDSYQLTNYNISVTGTSSFYNSSFELPNQSVLTVESGAKFTVVSGSNVFLSGNSVLYVKDGAELIFEESADLVLSGGSELFIESDAAVIFREGSKIEALKGSRIRGSFTLENNVSIEVHDNSDLGLQFTHINFPNTTTIKMGNNAKLNIENGSDISFGNGINIELSEGSEIVVWTKAYLTAAGTSFTYTGSAGNWLGINAIGGSSVGLDKVKISNAETGIRGFGNYKFNVTNSEFTNCVNGIEVSGMASSSKYSISGNKLTGTNSGTGISVTSSQAETAFEKNAVRGFNTGVRFVHSSPVFRRNIIENNTSYGLKISGQSSIPHLIDDDPDVYNQLNNSIVNNGINLVSTKSLTGPGQIGISPYASVYMQSGRNNVYSGPADTTPSVRCIQIDQMVGPHANDIIIQAEGNYWGSYRVTDDFFSDHIHYTIDYSPWSLNPFSTGGSPPLQTPQRKLLGNAISLEEKGNYTAANKIYEMLLKRFRNSPEYFVTLTRLPGLYEKAGIDDSSLIAMFDSEIGSVETTNKKFYKSMKVTAHILSKRYDPAIDVAQEMKSEAEYEEEIILADINIAIANMLKDMENEGKGGKSGTGHSATLSSLLAKLNGNEGAVNSPSDIAENSLPSQHELFQNYPNPFNPVTQIRFALAKTADVKLSVYNISGQLVSQLASGTLNAGVHAVDFDGIRLNSGVYYYTLEVDNKSMTKKMVLTK